MFILGMVVLFLLWKGSLRTPLGLNRRQYATLELNGLAVLGGLIGGLLFSFKWLYHSLAKGIWNQDRIVWRILTPFNSLGLAFVVLCLMRAGTLPLIDQKELNHHYAILGSAFLVGYFSDLFISALNNFVSSLFKRSS
jgi:hypothetical protein